MQIKVIIVCITIKKKASLLYIISQHRCKLRQRKPCEIAKMPLYNKFMNQWSDIFYIKIVVHIKVMIVCIRIKKKASLLYMDTYTHKNLIIL